MSTQGIVSIVSNGKTLIKAIAGDNGFQAPLLAERIRKERLVTAKQVYNAAQELRFGCDDCLIVMDEWGEVGHENALDGFHEHQPLYRQTFDKPEFNPRWEQGTADYVILVDTREIKRGQAQPDVNGWFRMDEVYPPVDVEVMIFIPKTSGRRFTGKPRLSIIAYPSEEKMNMDMKFINVTCWRFLPALPVEDSEHGTS